MNALKSIACSIAALATAGVLLCAGSASAQTFESVHGRTTCMETGRGVVVASQGGYVSVGETYSRLAACNQADVYVTRVRDDGNQHWGRAYDIGGDDFVTSVKEVFFGTAAQRGFIITGVTQNTNSSCSGPGLYDLFLLRIDYCGNVLWCRTYGTPTTADEGWEVVEARVGVASMGTNPGDIIVAGSTTFPNGTAFSPRNGYLLRVDGTNGNIIWDAYYDGPNHGDDYFYSMDETRNGDVVAAGGTDSYDIATNPAGYQGWIARVSGNNGQFNGLPHNTATYGAQNFEEFRSIRELRNTSHLGDLVATGVTASASPNNDVYFVQTGADPCTLVGDLVFGNPAVNAPSGGYAVREIPFNGGTYQAGEVIVTGYTWNANAGRQEDVFLQVVRPGNLTTLVPPSLNGILMRYGGTGMDWGWAVEPVIPPTGSACRSAGFIVAGFTLSPNLIGADQGQLYLIKTDPGLNANCTDDRTQLPWRNPLWRYRCEILPAPPMRVVCTPPVLQVCMSGWCRYCYCRLTTQACALPSCTPCQSTSADEICLGTFRRFCTPTKSLISTDVESDATLSELGSVPNPVKQGNDLTLTYRLAADAVMSVSVNDLTGREVHSGTVNGTVGEGSIAIATKGWAMGVYVVSVKVGKDVTATRVVVTE